MNKDDKELLIKEISSRLPYGVMCTDLRHGDSKITEVNTEDDLVYCYDFDEYIKVKDCRLYLRPLSSMTEEEKEEYCNLQDKLLCSSQYPVTDAYELFDWLNAHHFDYRGLIEKGLALEAPEGMYK